MKLADVSIKRPVFATVLVGVLLVFGIVAYPKIGVDLMPDVEFPFVAITTVYPGADPESVETKVVEKIEEAVSSIAAVKTIRSTSMESAGVVLIQFELERDGDQAVQDVRDKVSAILRTLPSDLEAPVIQKFDVNSTPIMAVTLSGKRGIRELTQIADEDVKQKLQTIAGVGSIDIVGGQEREFKVWIDPERLASYGLTVSDAVSLLRAQNMDIPGGRLENATQEFSVKTRGQVHSATELGALLLTSSGGAPIRVTDIARVEDGQVEKRSHSALDGQAAVALLIRKQSGSNTVEMAHKVRERLATIQTQLPGDLQISVPNDNSVFIEAAISGVKEDLVIGAVLAVLIILFFMRDWRATLIGAIALPTSVIATMMFLQIYGFTFNYMTMLALSLSIGMLIDDAIVVIENVHRHLEQGKSPLQAASDGVAEIGLAVLATTLSVVAVFLPVAMMKGIIGRFFLQFGVTVATAVLLSLFVALTLTPMLSSRLLKRDATQRSALSRAIGRLLDGLTDGYRGLARWALGHQAVILGTAALLFIGSVLVATKVPTEFMGEQDQSQFKVIVELPTGTSLPASQEYVAGIDAQLRALPWVETTFLTLGGGSQGEVNKAEVQINMVPKAQRTFSQQEAMVFTRKLFAARPGATFAVESVPIMGGGAGSRSATLQFNLRGRDYAALDQGAQQIVAQMKAQGGYVDLDTTYRGGKPEVIVEIDRQRAADLGVPVAVIASTVRTFFAGEKASELETEGERYDVLVQLDEDHRRTMNDITQLKVRSASGLLVPLANLVTVTVGSGPAKIERQDRARQVTVLANLEGKTIGQATPEVSRLAESLPPGITTGFTGQADMMQESFGHLITALVLAILMVYLILAAQFESFLHPLTIMLSLPLALVGAIGGLLITGQTMSIFSMIGIIMLMGLVTKNAILLVDYTNTLRGQGLARREALVEAGAVRLRPILMTTMAMILGMLPVALALSEGGEMRSPMAVVVIGGLLTSMLLTLVVVPVAYQLLDGLKERVLGRPAVPVALPAEPVPAEG